MIVLMNLKYSIVLVLHLLILALGQNEQLTISKQQNINASALTGNGVNSAMFENTSEIFVNNSSNSKILEETPMWQMVLDYRYVLDMFFVLIL